MMNCFEARPQFVYLWRDTLDVERRAALLAHLKECAKCDRAFRAFALTAPMLHSRGADAAGRASGREPAQTSVASSERAQVVRLDPGRAPRTDAARTAEIMRRAAFYRPKAQRAGGSWDGVAGAVSIAAAAILLAWVSVASPPQSLSDALMATQQLARPASTQLFGQPMPEIPNDLVG